MKTAARVFFLLFGLVLAATGLFALAAAVNLVPGVGTSLPWLPWMALPIAGGAALVVGLVFLVAGLRPAPSPPDTVLQYTELGEVRINIQAIENMVMRVLQQNSGIKESSRRVVHSPEGLVVSVRVKVMPDLELPALTAELQQKIRDYIENITGIKVAAVRVLVENIVTDLAAQRKTQK